MSDYNEWPDLTGEQRELLERERRLRKLIRDATILAEIGWAEQKVVEPPGCEDALH